jgi:hypothetical protein
VHGAFGLRDYVNFDNMMSQVKVSANPESAASPDQQRCHAPIPKINKIPTICSVPPEQGNTTLGGLQLLNLKFGGGRMWLHCIQPMKKIDLQKCVLAPGFGLINSFAWSLDPSVKALRQPPVPIVPPFRSQCTHRHGRFKTPTQSSGSTGSRGRSG